MKRFSETTKWADPWFRKLAPAHKAIWWFLCDNCDNAGCWKVDLDLAAMMVGCRFAAEDVFPAFNEGKERVQEIQGGKYWHVTGFVTYQFGRLQDNNNLHRSVRTLLEDRGLLCNGDENSSPKHPLTRGPSKGKGKGISSLDSSFLEFWTAYPRKVGKDKAAEAWAKKSPSLTDVLTALAWQVESDDWTKDGGKYIPYPATYLNQGRWQDEPKGKKQNEIDELFNGGQK